MKFASFIILVLVIINVVTSVLVSNRMYKRRFRHLKKTGIKECVNFCSKGKLGKCQTPKKAVECLLKCNTDGIDYCQNFFYDNPAKNFCCGFQLQPGEKPDTL